MKSDGLILACLFALLTPDMDVPEGRWYLVPQSDEWYVKRDDLSYEGPFAVTVNYGGGVDVQFEAVGKLRDLRTPITQ